MANTTFTVAAVAPGGKMAQACAGSQGTKGAQIKLFSFTAGNANYGPAGGMTLDLSALFPTKVLSVFITPVSKSDYTDGYMARYIPGTNGAPGTGKVVLYRQTAATSALIEITADSVNINGYVGHGWAIGY